ncbi:MULTISPECIES: acyl-CoA carboxylase epsilon subunit [Streptomyces]|uniref:acyl-CoA carboxylase epsilon subunit n=1 Tax=Streptomyces TaxID=1883 RepID=UPI0004C8A186|nr:MULTISPECIES: acyl-CoA carboxylase epsilon subunit [Streptomyces]MDX2920822.1 acyl-CoA carboxylase epsilon subunit [Streptomyces sp. NE06-03C]MDX3609225.1 acyl-CoA carboxylase epsilon subunit [Streptomyces sp. FL06-04B]MDX3734713.1 acyl-CoA carboxylase epsilon subunit [Streptomyces sp. ID01-15D]
MIKVVRGNPTPEELAAAVAVVQARAAAASAVTSGAPLPPEQWSDPGRIARTGRPWPGPRAWARTYWPA